MRLQKFYFSGVLNGPDIRKLVASERFENLLSPFEREAFINLKLVIRNFLGNNRADNYREIVDNMLMSFKRINVNVSLKIHFLQQHIDFFRDNLGKISDEHGERFHQQIRLIETRFQGKNVESMLAEFVWYSLEDHEENIKVEPLYLASSCQAELRQSRLRLLQKN